MSKKKNHLNGKERFGKHTTLTDATSAVVKKVRRAGFRGIKIRAGRMCSTKNGPCGVKIVEETNKGFNIRVRGARSIQDISLHISSHRKGELKDFLEEMQ